MPQLNTLVNGSKPAVQFLWEVQTLPCDSLQEKLLHLVNVQSRAFNLMLNAVSVLARLATDRRLQGSGNHGSILFSGPPGCGKSTLAAVLPHLWALQTGLPGKVVRINAHAVASSEHGQSQRNVGRLFDAITGLCEDRSCVVFVHVDELETLATDRNEISGKTSPVDARNAVNAFLEQTDRKPANCLFLGTTNTPELVDPAVVNRFDFHFRMKALDAPTRLKALSSSIAKLNPHSSALRGVPKAVLEELKSLTDGFSFRDIRSLVLWCVVLHDMDMSLDGRQLVVAAKYLRNSSLSKGDLP